jgi:hypothetical protein
VEDKEWVCWRSEERSGPGRHLSVVVVEDEGGWVAAVLTRRASRALRMAVKAACCSAGGAVLRTVVADSRMPSSRCMVRMAAALSARVRRRMFLANVAYSLVIDVW